MIERLRGAVALVRERTSLVPRAALVLGPGVELEADLLAAEVRVDLAELGTTVTLGRIAGVPAAWLSEANDASGVRVLGLLGAEVLVVTGVCRALDPSIAPGDLALVDDHLNLLGRNPLVGENTSALGPRFPDMSEAYDPTLRALARDVAIAAGLRIGSGVFAAVPDANRRTPGEYTRLRQLGADLVGQGVVPDVIVARHMGLRVLALLAVTGDRAAAAGPQVGRVLRGLMPRLGGQVEARR